MRIAREDLDKFNRPVGPPPPPIEPVLPPAEEAKLIATGPSDDPGVKARRDRVIAILWRAATPTGADAELVALLADARALPLERREDRFKAHQRLVGIGRSADPPPAVRRLMQRHGIAPGDGAAFADALMRRGYDGSSPFHESDFGVSPT